MRIISSLDPHIKFPSTLRTQIFFYGCCMPLAWILMSTGNCIALLPHLERYSFMTNLINLNILLFPRLIMDYFQLLTMILYFGMLDRMREFFIQRQSNIDAVIETRNTIQLYEKFQKIMEPTTFFMIGFA